MAKFDDDIAVLGGGAAGLTIASGASQLGARTVLVEREESLGGNQQTVGGLRLFATAPLR